MDISAFKSFLLWCMIVNAAVLLLTSMMLVFFGDFSYRMNHKFFSISRQEFNVICVSFLALYKIVFLTFNLVPYIALVIIG